MPIGTAALRCLTFEVSGSRRRGARPARCRINHRGARAWRLAVGSPLDRGVRPHRYASEYVGYLILVKYPLSEPSEFVILKVLPDRVTVKQCS